MNDVRSGQVISGKGMKEQVMFLGRLKAQVIFGDDRKEPGMFGKRMKEKWMPGKRRTHHRLRPSDQGVLVRIVHGLFGGLLQPPERKLGWSPVRGLIV